MRTILLVTILLTTLLGGCSKDKTPVNFSCLIAGTAINSNKPGLLNGYAVGSFNTSNYPPYFQLTMNGSYGQAVSVIWYGIDSPVDAGHITPKAYTLPAYAQPPLTIAAAYQSSATSAIGQSSYYTGVGRNLGGTVTVTNNTGAGGVISGTFSFNALNQSYPYDTVYVTSGTFTNVAVPAQ
jgi:hypothetical protein